MGDQGATGGAWGARDEASWWSGGAGEIQNQQLNAEVARSTEGSHQMYTYKVASGFSNNSGADTSSPNYEYRIMQGSNSRDEPAQQQWWYGSDANQSSSSPTQNQSNQDNDQGSQRGNSNQQQNHQSLQQQQAQQEQAMQQQQNQMMQQMLHQQSQENQGQTLQQILHQHTQQQLQQNIQQTLQVSQAQAQAIVQAQQALQEHVAQSMQQTNLHEQMQQQQLQAAIQRQQSNTLQALNQAQSQQGLPQPVHKGRMPRAKGVNKPRGRMTAYAFFVQTCREEHKKKHPDENVIFAAFSKKCAERWNTMNEKEKQRFQEMAEQDKKRYELEMQNYVPPMDAKVRGRKRQQLKDPNAPKRSLSAFFWFCNDERSKVKANNPDYTMGDIAKELGRRWAAVDPETKGKYEQLSEQDKQRYDREMTAYKKGPLLAQAQQQALAAQAQRPAELQVVGEYEDDEYN